MRRARLATELADRQLDESNALRAGSPLPLALSLYREAAYWTLRAHQPQLEAGSLREALDSRTSWGEHSGLTDAEFAEVRIALVDKSFVDTADERPELQRHEAEVVRRFLRGLQRHWPTGDALTSRMLERFIRSGVLLLVVLCGLFAALVVIQRWWQGPDLAAGKPWRISSQQFECHPKNNECGGAKTNIFFHTTEENSPWFEIDLGQPVSFARVKITNRDDCCLERAIPLVIEVSSDRAKWQRVARRPDSFRAWDATFGTVTARYVRLRVERYATLHLGKVSVHAR